MSNPLYFCIRVPEFAAQALVRLRPALAHAAVAVLEGDPPLEKTCAATLQARRLGIRHGMTRTEVEGMPQLTLLRRSVAEERNAASVLLEMAARFTPRTEELPRSSAHMLALDMSGSTRIFGAPHVIGQKLFRAAREIGFFSRVVSSRNLHTAICLARGPGSSLVTVPPGEERAYLQQLPLGALDLTAELLDTLSAWGLQTAGDLAALLPADLVARLGQEGHRLHRLASGQHDHLLIPAEPAFTLEEHLAFDAPVDNLESLLFVLAPMLDQLIARARNRALLLASVTVRLHLERPTDQTDRDRRHDEPLPTPPSGSAPPSRKQSRGAATKARNSPDSTTSPRPPHSASKIRTARPKVIHSAGGTAEPTHSPPHHPTGPSAATNRAQATSAPRLPFAPAEPETAPCSPPVHERTLKPALPLDDRRLLLKLLQLDLQSHPAPAAIVAITLEAEAGARPGVQSGLFSPQSPEPARLEVTLARLTALVGSGRVGQAVLVDSHAHESFRMDRFLATEPSSPKPARPRNTQPFPELAPTRTGIALRHLRPAAPVEVTHADGRPYTLRLRVPNLPPKLTVCRAFGPWRRSGHWWSHQIWSREEWDIEAQSPDGTQFFALLTRDRLRLQWQLEAFYD